MCAGAAQSVKQLIRNYQAGSQKIEYATVAQSVEQLIRNQQVVCSSHISSSRKRRKSNDFRRFCNFPEKIVDPHLILFLTHNNPFAYRLCEGFLLQEAVKTHNLTHTGK